MPLKSCKFCPLVARVLFPDEESCDLHPFEFFDVEDNLVCVVVVFPGEGEELLFTEFALILWFSQKGFVRGSVPLRILSPVTGSTNTFGSFPENCF